MYFCDIAARCVGHNPDGILIIKFSCISYLYLQENEELDALCGDKISGVVFGRSLAREREAAIRTRCERASDRLSVPFDVPFRCVPQCDATFVRRLPAAGGVRSSYCSALFPSITAAAAAGVPPILHTSYAVAARADQLTRHCPIEEANIVCI